MKMVGSMYVEVNGDDGYHGVVEIAMMENQYGEVQPGGVRDAVTRRQPERLPATHDVFEAIQLTKWSYLNQPVFEGRTSNVSVNKWESAADNCINDVLRDDDPESN